MLCILIALTVVVIKVGVQGSVELAVRECSGKVFSFGGQSALVVLS